MRVHFGFSEDKKQMTAPTKNPQAIPKAFLDSVFPIGMICLWSGDEIPYKWILYIFEHYILTSSCCIYICTNTHANLQRHGTVQTVIRLIDTLTFPQSTYNLRHYIGALLILTLI